MKNRVYSIIIAVFAILTTSCNKDEDAKLVNPEYKNIEVSGEVDLQIPVLASNWEIEMVKDANSGSIIVDREQKPLSLKGYGTVESANDWLTLERNSDNQFIVYLKENFYTEERSFTICINDNGTKDYITIKQIKGKGYKLINTKFQEIEEMREIYSSDEGCRTITLTNYSAEAQWKPSGKIFEYVVYSSSFESDDYGAFQWNDNSDLEIRVPELIIDNAVRGNCRTVVYKQQATTIPYINESSTLVHPYTPITLRGEITYCKRVCQYTFRIENLSSGGQFDIQGTWTEITPISSTTIFVE